MKEISNQIPNNFILSNYNTSIVQRRVVYAILMQIEKVMEYPIPGESPIFEIPKEIVMDGYGHLDLKKGCKDLLVKILTVKENDENEEFHFILPFTEISVEKNSPYIRVHLNKKVAKIFYEIKKGYSKINYKSALGLSSLHAQKLYEFFCMKINNYEEGETALWFTTVNEVKEILGVKDKYNDGKDFRKRILETTKKQLESTDLEISYDLEKKGRAYHFITFYINKRDEKSDFEKIEMALKDDKSKRCLKALIDLGIFDKKIQKTIIEQYQQAFWKWNHAVKIGAIKPKTNPAGHLLKTLGLK